MSLGGYEEEGPRWYCHRCRDAHLKAPPGEPGGSCDRAESGITAPGFEGGVVGRLVPRDLDKVPDAPFIVGPSVAPPACSRCGRFVHPGKECEQGLLLFEAEKPDMVNNPPHYTAHPSGVECIEITEHFNFCRGNAMKYLWRAGLKGASAIEDLKKSRWYLDREIARLEKE